MRNPNLLVRIRVALPAITMCLICLPLSGLLSGHIFALGGKGDSGFRVPLVEDWTHRQLIYSAPFSMIQNLELQRQPRYFQQYLRRNVRLFRRPAWPTPTPIDPWPRRKIELARDWGIAAGSCFTVGEANFPAKFTFDVNQTPSCTADYVVFTTSQTGAAVTDIYAVNNLYVNSTGTGYCSGTSPKVLWAYHV